MSAAGRARRSATAFVARATVGAAVVACALAIGAGVLGGGGFARAEDAETSAEDAGTSAEPAGTSAEQEVSPAAAISRGRALGWGFAALVPVLFGDALRTDGRTIAYLSPGGGVEGHVGFELAGGISLGVLGGASVFASENSRALASYRGAAEARWTIDVGSIVAPSFAIAVGVFFAQLDDVLAVSAYARVLAGAQIVLAPWAALDAGVALEGALAVDPLASPLAWITPQVGVSFYE